jgi:hypothetical protein
MKLSPEVLIYIQNVKDYFKKNEEASEYFLKDSNEQLFYEHMTEIAQKNFDDNGDPMLNQYQFELLKRTVQAIHIAQKPDSEFIKPEKKETHDLFVKNNIFVEFPNFGMICLN